MANPANWLGGPYNPSVGLDTQLRDKLIELRVLEDPADEARSAAAKPGSATPQTLQVVTAGAHQLSKFWTAIVGTGFGLSALLQAIVGLGWEPLGIDSPEATQQAVLTASAAVVAAALVIAIAMMVKGDVHSRALATAAQYQARAAMTAALVDAFKYAAVEQAHYLLSHANGTGIVESFGMDKVGFYALLNDGTTVRYGDFRSLEPVPK